MKRFIVGITGASGVIYGVRLVEALAADPAHEVHLIISPAGARVLAEELDRRPRLSPFDPHSLFRLAEGAADRIRLHPFADIGAGPASGTFRADAMVIGPCSVKTLGAVAAGLADNLITRAADVTLKEGRPLLLVPRETPHNLIHLRNMVSLAEAGAIILPASPAFYHRPATIDDLVRYVVQKILDRLGVAAADPIRWRDPAA
ncbi:MAG TPA: flavin prenyltransferase UbiX [Candidatus Sumerlaeota bacterium]|nr:flavin prenyltransferase UbiX [Candidatus Sumerlaeota bacterium]